MLTLLVHAEGDTEGHSIHTIQFDPHLNEVVDIGTNIDILNFDPHLNEVVDIGTNIDILNETGGDTTLITAAPADKAAERVSITISLCQFGVCDR
ncbi:unnamed protein product [Strongylus vulgaris]|uniref:Uncharacterized protein n=1 Tax=Strongylus vulgaris TaxID=40348 RepID=A0A3P7LH99_STRVU|nr:unnamed protein product [Strongylus vulgaris]